MLLLQLPLLAFVAVAAVDVEAFETAVDDVVVVVVAVFEEIAPVDPNLKTGLLGPER